MPRRENKKCPLNETIAYNIKRLRFINGMTQHDLANIVGVSSLVISRIETLRIQKIDGKILNAIEEYYKVGYGYLDQSGVRDVPSPKFVKMREPSTINKFCRICGTKLYADSKYCHNCGTKVLI